MNEDLIKKSTTSDSLDSCVPFRCTTSSASDHEPGFIDAVSIEQARVSATSGESDAVLPPQGSHGILETALFEQIVKDLKLGG